MDWSTDSVSLAGPCSVLAKQQGLCPQSQPTLVPAITATPLSTVLVLGTKAGWEGESSFLPNPLGAERMKGLLCASGVEAFGHREALPDHQLLT